METDPWVHVPYDRMNPTMKELTQRLATYAETTYGQMAYQLSRAEANLLLRYIKDTADHYWGSTQPKGEEMKTTGLSLKEAHESGRKYRPIGTSPWMRINPEHGVSFGFATSEFELEPIKKEISREQLQDAMVEADVRFCEVTFDRLCQELGL